MNFCQSLRSNTVVRTRLDDREFSYPIVAKETPANPGRLERSMQDQDVVEPVIPGPSKDREPLVENASPYRIEPHEENVSDTTERSYKQAVLPSSHQHPKEYKMSEDAEDFAAINTPGLMALFSRLLLYSDNLRRLQARSGENRG